MEKLVTSGNVALQALFNCSSDAANDITYKEIYEYTNDLEKDKKRVCEKGFSEDGK
jgi:hypothetical protein